MHYLFIFNPQAAHGKALKLLPKIQNIFDKKQISLDVKKTQYPHHAIELVAQSNFDLYDGIILCGGDGTLFDVVNGMFQNKSIKKLPVGIIPVGTGNAFVKDIGLETNEWEKAIDKIANQQTKKVDVGKFITENKTWYFINIIGLGFVADANYTACTKFKAVGNIGYTLAVLWETIFLKNFPVTLVLDGKQIDRDNIFIEISNTRYTSNFLMAPNAIFDDGYFDVTLLNKISRTGLIKAFPKVFTGEHIHLKTVETFRAKKIKVNTVNPKVLAPDGELLGSTPVEIECLHQAIEIYN